MTDSIKSINKPLHGSLKPVEPKPADENDKNTLMIVWGTTEPDGTVRKATPEEAAEYDSYCD